MGILALQGGEDVKNPYLIISDLHFHNWSTFDDQSKLHNTRLELQIDAMLQAFDHLKSVGGDTVVITGDLFHKRTGVAQAVLNTVYDAFYEAMDHELLDHIWILAGNHDLFTDGSNALHNTSSVLDKIKNIDVVSNVQSYANGFSFVPWTKNLEDLHEKIKIDSSARDVSDDTLFLHAPITGVLPGLKGLDPEWLKSLGYKNVFAGHYHNRVNFGDGVWSVGALMHQSFKDIDSKAGYLIVVDGVVHPFETKHPKFVDHTSGDIAGNYVRIKQGFKDDAERKSVVATVKAENPAGLIVRETKAQQGTRADIGVEQATSTAVAVDSYIAAKYAADEDLQAVKLKAFEVYEKGVKENE